MLYSPRRNRTYSAVLPTAVLLAFLLFSQSCSEPQPAQPAVSEFDTTGVSTSGAILLQGKMVVIPPPALLSHVIAKESIPFETRGVTDAGNTEQWTSEMKKALNLGVLGADLSYLINYRQSATIPQYLASIRRLTADLDISRDVDAELLSQIEAGLDNPSSILGLNSVFFRNLESYLKSNNRHDLSTYILLGGWTEAMHQLASPADSIAGQPLDRLLAEQTFSASGVRALAESIQDDSFTAVKSAIIELCDALETLEKTYLFNEPVHDRRQGITYLRSKTEVSCSDDELLELHELIRETRNLIVTP